MKITYSEKGRKIIRYIIGTLSFSSCLFIFQACYGTAQDYLVDDYIHGVVKSKTTNEPIKGIKVSLADKENYSITTSDGSFSIYYDNTSLVKLKIEDVDGGANGYYASIDTVLSDRSKYSSLEIFLHAKN